ncbi:GNAT family N-acetyltransferase [Antrihabitans cavernicola]|uniref:GNAT family N-acetyltransferase n=1 Tax=Antrihabitans cavernicola TaxID=2495913 RepID=A0A5A7SAS6_9NOCA|nr:GNAT family N-acetyltransferase [Spelaeibacter cavernicola]KAA0022262.1 GNAT family N-acetyltransferase [Spelaeibacter cavernicola]
MTCPPLSGSTVQLATHADAAELLVLQRCCWVTEAIANDTLSVPPLHEDLATVARWIDDMSVWVVRVDGRLVGSVRAVLVDGGWQIGRLMVAPDLSGYGLGRWLLELAERNAPLAATRLELFAGSRSERNLRMYASAGYVARPPDPLGIAQHISGATYLVKALGSGACG